ncbi:Two-component signal transduction system YycFG, regulatory protein YycI [Oceanobacillus limi]|uniref:Two-component signal transduction system YycFG, regulatory protein YycI n=1 Tax=Oceanobacillus limi TaxID=930131 RepID=A0A1I0CYB5_9BACI|nr:two-component system regulatory protein YycI [Oceanobacillus limi]SET24668.1 Two-component signal transduction system YycFG, regulatory protein YycI [Oceanobacillus limi]
MQWGQIKTVFIICFLLLDIYLIVLFLEKEQSEDYSTNELTDLSIEEQLKLEEIGIDNLPEEQPDEERINVQQKQFTDEEKDSLNSFGNQVSEVVDNSFILSLFEEPISIPDEATNEEINQVVKGNIIFAGEFDFEYRNDEANVLVFFQEKNGRTVYFNHSGLLLVLLNENNEMTGYVQTVLGDPEKSSDKSELIKPITAVGTLLDNYRLFSGDEVTDMEIGYHTFFPLENGVQVFVPTWKVEVNEEHNHFINALEKKIFPTDELTFIEEAIDRSLERARSIGDNLEFRENMVSILLEKYEVLNRSEEQ